MHPLNGTRRRFLARAAWVCLGVFIPYPVHAVSSAPSPQRRTLSLLRVQTAETLSTTYHTRSGYVARSLEDISRLMRDLDADDVKTIDPLLLDYLHDIKTLLGLTKPFHVTSGYRTPQTNAALRRAGRAAAPNSYHMKGMAVDLYLPGRRSQALRKAALEVGSGGVGHYPNRNYIHLDVGPFRCWTQ